jgi:hypothetical protein
MAVDHYRCSGRFRERLSDIRTTLHVSAVAAIVTAEKVIRRYPVAALW